MMRSETLALDRFRASVADLLGLEFGESKRDHLQDVLDRRLRARALNPEEYLAGLTRGSGEVAELARELSVSETYFFRNPAHYQVLRSLVRDWPRSTPLRILSAGCCTGEEPYSIAIVAYQATGGVHPDHLSIVGIDANPASLSLARGGSYSTWSLRQTPPEVRDRYFKPDGKKFSVKDPIRRLVRFEERNLVEPDPAFWRPEAFDVIFCRNVIMYFNESAREGVLGRLARALTPRAPLFLGHAESLSRHPAFVLQHEGGTFFYRRAPAEPSAPAPPLAAPKRAPPPALVSGWEAAIGLATAKIAALASPGPRRPSAPTPEPSAGDRLMKLLLEERYAEALGVLGPEDPAEASEQTLLRAIVLAQSGEVVRAQRVCQRLLRDAPSAGAHYVFALCCEQEGDLVAARGHDERASQLEPGFAMPHLHLALMARRSRDAAAARLEFGRARALLAGESAARIALFGGGFSREALLELCRTELLSDGGLS